MVKRKSSKFFVVEGISFQIDFNQAPMRYLVADEKMRVLREVHSGDCDGHEGGSRLSLGPLLAHCGGDTASFARRWQACQLNINKIHASVIE